MPGPGPEVPQLFAAVSIVGADHAFDVAVDDEPAAGRQDAADRRIFEVDAPLALAGHGIARVQMPVRLTAGRVLRHLIAAEEQPGGRLRHRRLILDGHLFAHFHRGVVPEAGLRVIRARVPAPPAGDPGADEVRLAEPRGITPDELARLRVDALHPVVDVVHRPHVLDLAVGPVVHEHEAALVLVDQELLAVTVEHQALPEPGIVVPVVVGDLLVVPLELTVVRIERQDGRCVEIVAGACIAPVIVRRRVGRAPVDKVQCWVIGARHPAAAAPELPRVAAPALLIVLDRVELPRLLAVRDLQGEDLALDGQFARGLAQDDLVPDDQGRPGEVAAALLGVEHRDRPQLLARLHVEGDDAAVEGAEDHLAVPDGDAAVVGLEEERVDDRVELREVVPDLPPGGAVEREHAVVRAAVVEHPVHDDGRRLEPLNDRARLVHPRHAQVLDVRLIDLPQGAEPVSVVRPVVHRPVVRLDVQEP